MNWLRYFIAGILFSCAAWCISYYLLPNLHIPLSITVFLGLLGLFLAYFFPGRFRETEHISMTYVYDDAGHEEEKEEEKGSERFISSG
jgi:hypothetical protein